MARVWVEIEEFDTARGIVDWERGNYFEAITREYLASGKGRAGKVGAAPSYLFDAADLVEFAIEWMERSFVEGGRTIESLETTDDTDRTEWRPTPCLGSWI